MRKTFGALIAELRKEKGMTQVDLAEKMGVTDKAVSKWERDLSYPDINSIPNLAQILDVSVDELLQSTKNVKKEEKSVKEIVNLILKSIPLAMGIGVAVLSILKSLSVETGIMMLGIGLACLSIALLDNE